MGAIVRPAELADAAAMLAIYEPFVLTTPISFETEVPAEPEFRSRIEKILPRLPWLVCEAEGAIGGYAYATRYREREAYQWSVEATVYVAPGFHRRGIGACLYDNLFRCLRAQGFMNGYAAITLPNSASVALHERAGFEPVGVYRRVGYKLGRWHDVGWWALALRKPPSEPRPPLPMADVLGRMEWTPPRA